MAPEGSVSRWLGPLQQGDPEAVQQLCQRYFLNLVQLARLQLRLQRPPLRAFDDADLAQAPRQCARRLDQFRQRLHAGRSGGIRYVVSRRTLRIDPADDWLLVRA